jgi:hypothetical protein
VDDRFFTAYFPGRARICGRVLVDFTPYHYLLLKAIDSPFLKDAGINRPSDLLAAISVCRKVFGRDVKLKPGFSDVIWKISMERSDALFRREAVKFSKWISAHSSGPKFWDVISGGGRTRELTGPDVLTLVVPLMTKAHMSECDVWNMSLGRAQWLNAEIQELEGSERRFLFDQDLIEEGEENA